MNVPSIIIVDDDPSLLQALPQALYLRIEGIKIDTCESALEALTYLQERDYDAVVSDIKMPGMDGLALLAKIQELRPETPTLLITGHGDHHLTISALRGGAYDFIQKPIDRDYFVAALRRAIQTHQLRRQVVEQQRELELHAKSLENIVQERTRELARANAAKDEFLSIASHELKTPLSSLKAMTQLLRRRHERTNSAEATDLVSMERSIRRMEILINDLLDTSLIETGMFSLRYTHSDPVTLCQHILKEYASAMSPSILFEAYQEPLKVEMDVDRIGQVILNLLSNARKYSPKESPITLKLTRTDDACIIAVYDKGVGIPEEKLAHIFDRFYRVPGIEVQTGSSVGLGLGLYISQKIVERHGGRIEVHSVPGNGSIFSIVLPLSPPTRMAENNHDDLQDE